MENRNFNTEIQFRTSRSSGKGGQHVNKVETRVELLFDLHQSKLLKPAEKKLLALRWANRLNKEGILRIVCQKSRSQLKNKEKALSKFYILLEKGLKVSRPRKKKRLSFSAKLKRLKDKKAQSDKKQLRQKITF